MPSVVLFTLCSWHVMQAASLSSPGLQKGTRGLYEHDPACQGECLDDALDEGHAINIWTSTCKLKKTYSSQMTCQSCLNAEASCRRHFLLQLLLR